MLSLGALGYLSFGRGALDLGWVYDNYVPLLSASAALSLALSLYLYARSFARGRLLAAGGSSGVRLYDFFIGRELNPRLGALDLKEFCELYPGEVAGGRVQGGAPGGGTGGGTGWGYRMGHTWWVCEWRRGRG